MIFPISHDESTVRRWPWITVAIIVLNVAVFVGTRGRMQAQSDRASRATAAALQHYIQHPYLVAPADLRGRVPTRIVPSLGQSTSQEEFERIQREVFGRRDLSEAEAARARERRIETEQQTLDRLTVEMRSAQRDRLIVRHGNVPAQHSLTGLVTSQFLHAGWLHLLVNLWFLWLLGCNVEDRWGRVTFASFYLSSGVAAALIHDLSNWGSTAPMIGASGAIAGVMGAFLVRFKRTKIRFAYWYTLRPGTFTAPAYLMLPLWAAKELIEWGLLGETDTTAHWAHVGGFGYGVAFALVVAASGFERRLDRMLERRDIVSERDPAVAAASALVDQGRLAEALEALDELRAKRPNDLDVRLELLRAARAAGDTHRQTQGRVELIGLYLRQGAEDAAVELYHELLQSNAESALSLELRFRIARRLERQGRLAHAEQEYAKIHSGPLEEEAAFQAILAHAALYVRERRKTVALELYARAKEAVSAHLLLETTLQQGLRAAQALPDKPETPKGQDGHGPDTHDDGVPEIECREAPVLVLMERSDPPSSARPGTLAPGIPARTRTAPTPTLLSAVSPEQALPLERSPQAVGIVSFRTPAAGSPASKRSGGAPLGPASHAPISKRPGDAGRYSLRPGSVVHVDIVAKPSDGPGASARRSARPAADTRELDAASTSAPAREHYTVSLPSVESVRQMPSRQPVKLRSPSGLADATQASEQVEQRRPTRGRPPGEDVDLTRGPRRE